MGGRSALICGYHGRPLAHDLCMLTTVVEERLGYLPHGVIHAAFEKSQLGRRFIDGLGFVTGDGPSMTAAIARGEHILVAPGGTAEGCRPFWDHTRVSWGRRTGYLKLAIRHNLPIIPVACAGTDWTYIGLNDGYRLGKRVGMPARLPLWGGLGPLGLWPFSPPFPVRLTQRVGAPIRLPSGVDPESRAELLALHGQVTTAVQSLLEQAVAEEA